jgi:hypothetical protein
MRRLFWFLLGIVAGIYGTLWVRNTASDLSQRLSPSAILEQVVEVLRTLVERVKTAVVGSSGPDSTGNPPA